MAIKNNFKWLILIVVITNAINISCQDKKMEKKFDWSATLSAPEEYPVQVYRGEIIADDYTQSLTGFGPVSFGWGNQAGIVIMGPDLKNIPDSLDIAWHSFVDQKNFEGKWALPKEELTKLFNEGFTDMSTNQKVTYDTFLVGLAPNGSVVVWLAGLGNQIEVAHFKATEAFVNIETLADDSKSIFSKEYNDVVLEQLNEKFDTNERITSKTYPAITLYDKYRKLYDWKPEIALPNNSQLTNLVLHTYNGEIEIQGNDGKTKINIVDKKRAVLKKLSFRWEAKDDKSKASCWLEAFDEKELFEAYEKFDPSEQIVVSINVINDTKVSLKLKSKIREIEILKFNTTIE